VKERELEGKVVVQYTRESKHRKPEVTTANQGGEPDGGSSGWGDRGGDDSGFTNPVCVGAGDTTWTVVKSLSSDSNRANVSAR
jgi:hypothetical protein